MVPDRASIFTRRPLLISSLGRADKRLPATQPLESVVGGVLVCLAERGDVERVSIRPLQTTVISSEDQLDQTIRRPHDLGPWAVLKNPRPTSASMPCWLAVLAAVIPTIAASGIE